MIGIASATPGCLAIVLCVILRQLAALRAEAILLENDQRATRLLVFGEGEQSALDRPDEAED